MNIRFSSGKYSVEFLSWDQFQSDFPRDAFLITDEVVARHYPDLVKLGAHRLVLAAGEETKSLACFGQCLNWLAKAGATRKSQIVALGGGVIGDLVGFVASAYMRGISYIQVPTTLLAQVDSSVGGKVAIDLDEGKNLAGAFYPPSKVFICPEFLRSLPERQFNNGMAEVLKYGFICQPNLLSRTEDLQSLVRRCIEIKADIVQKDEFETTGLRATLNFGHTIGHAMEKTLKYRTLLHGEAVAIGMALEARLGENLGFTAKGSTEKVRGTLSSFGLPTTHPVLSQPAELVAAMYKDKKATDRSLTFSLLTRIGDCKIIHNVDEKAVLEVLAHG